jgi:hypothetical protein
MDDYLDDLLREGRLWRAAEPLGDTTVRGLSTGYALLDECLPEGGWPRRALTECLVDRYGLGELSLLMPALSRLMRASGWVFWIAPPFIPYAPALSAREVDPERMLLVHVSGAGDGGRDALWATEQALRSGHALAVLAWLPSSPGRSANERSNAIRHSGDINRDGGFSQDTALRRLQLAAEAGDSWAVLFRGPEAIAQRSPAALRIQLGPGDRLRILKCRGGRPRELSLEAVLRSRLDPRTTADAAPC